MILVWILVVGLAAYRSWRIVALDSITEPLRAPLYRPIRFVPYAVRDFLAQLIECPWCLGWWFAGIGAWLVSDAQDYGVLDFALLWLGASAICGATHTVLERLNR